MSGRHAFHLTAFAATAALVALLAILAGCGRAGRDFTREADALKRAPDSLRALALFRDWHAARPDDPEAYLSEANYWLARSQHARMAATKHLPDDDEDIPIRNSKGKVVGSYSEWVGLDTLLTLHAGGLLDPAIQRFPHRLDLYFAQAHIYEAVDAFDLERKTIVGTITAATAHPDAMRWTNGAALPMPAPQLVPAAVRAWAMHYTEDGSVLGDQRCVDLAELGAAAYPADSLLKRAASDARRRLSEPRPAKRKREEDE